MKRRCRACHRLKNFRLEERPVRRRFVRWGKRCAEVLRLTVAVDRQGRRWHGDMCPACKLKVNKQRGKHEAAYGLSA